MEALTHHQFQSQNKKATYYCPVVVPLTGRGMSKWLSSVDHYDNERIISTTSLVLSTPLEIFSNFYGLSI